MFFETLAHAMGAIPGGGQGGGGSSLGAFLPLILMFGIFYFLLIRPQQKKAKQHKTMLKELKKGDRVWTGGGIKGRITDIDGDTLSVEIAENVTIQVHRNFISSLVEAAANPQEKK
ncbi:MAG: preprotein translocase subunit YajC [Desulfovibrionaceae bacterium]|nr:preprotein translocase subunit YajC [Desulfovibrionaceae bacterium]